MFLFFVFILIISSNNIYSKDFPDIYGCFCEGGVITGFISDHNELKINNKKIELYEGGRFLFAFGRKHVESVKIEVDNNSKTFVVSNKDYKIEKIKGLPRNKVDPSGDELEKIISEKKKIEDLKKVGSKTKHFGNKFIFPAKGRLSGFYGSQRILNSKPRKPHAGIDLAAKEGTLVIAPSSGVVKLVAKDMFFTGNTIIIDHGLGLISIFAHLKDVFVKQGDFVNQGIKIGSIGMTGRATGPHLHWGVYLQRVSIDPLTLIEYELY